MAFPLHPSATAVLDEESSATAKAYRVVLDAIVSQVCMPGELISEGQVADELGMSRTPIREAFLRLKDEGLLVLYPKRGAVVTAHRLSEDQELLETQAMFEESAVGRLVDRGLPHGLAETLESMVEQEAETSDALEFVKLDFAFHHEVVESGGNSTSTGLFRQLGPRLLRYGYQAASAPPTRSRVTSDHRRLIELLNEGDTEGYPRYLRFHLGLTSQP